MADDYGNDQIREILAIRGDRIKKLREILAIRGDKSVDISLLTVNL